MLPQLGSAAFGFCYFMTRDWYKLRRVQPLAAAPELPTLEHRHLVRELVNLGLAVFKLAVLARNGLLTLVTSGCKLIQGGCCVKLGLVYAVNPRLARYSRGLSEPREILMRFSLYQRI